MAQGRSANPVILASGGRDPDLRRIAVIAADARLEPRMGAGCADLHVRLVIDVSLDSDRFVAEGKVHGPGLSDDEY
jgi:hypothetical protein